MIRVVDLYVIITQVVGIAVNKVVIPAFDGMVLNAITVQDIHLHTVVIDEEVAASGVDWVAAVIEEVVSIKIELSMRIQIIDEILFLQIYGGFEIIAIVPEIV